MRAFKRAEERAKTDAHCRSSRTRYDAPFPAALARLFCELYGARDRALLDTRVVHLHH